MSKGPPSDVRGARRQAAAHARAGRLREAAQAWTSIAEMDDDPRNALRASQAWARLGDAKTAHRWALAAAERFAERSMAVQALSALKFARRIAGGKPDWRAEHRVIERLGAHLDRDHRSLSPLAALREHGWLRTHLDDALELLAERTIDPGETLVREGEPAESMFFVVSGLLRAWRRQGNGLQRLGLIRPGEAIGEIAYFHDRRRTADVIAVRRSLLLVVPYDAIDRWAAQDAAFAARLEDSYRARMLRRLIAAAPLFAELTVSDRERIAARMEQVRLAAGSVPITEGDAGADLYLLRSGRAVVTQHLGGRERWIKDLGPGGVFGEGALVVGRRTATVRIVEDSIAYRLAEAEARALLAGRPAWRAHIERLVRAQLEETRAALYREQADLARLIARGTA